MRFYSYFGIKVEQSYIGESKETGMNLKRMLLKDLEIIEGYENYYKGVLEKD